MGSQILLLFTATKRIYWSSGLDISDQLQQSSAIFSCKTRQTGLTGCSLCGDTIQYNLEESVSHRRTRRDSLCYFIYAYFNVNMLNENYLLKIKNVK